MVSLEEFCANIFLKKIENFRKRTIVDPDYTLSLSGKRSLKVGKKNEDLYIAYNDGKEENVVGVIYKKDDEYRIQLYGIGLLDIVFSDNEENSLCVFCDKNRLIIVNIDSTLVASTKESIDIGSVLKDSTSYVMLYEKGCELHAWYRINDDYGHSLLK